MKNLVLCQPKKLLTTGKIYLFLNWMRLNPRAAIEVSEGHYSAWQAWAANNPGAAMAAAGAVGEEQVRYVAAAAGQFQQSWLREHFYELSEGARGQALVNMSKWIDTESPRESLDFLKKTGRTPDEDTFKALIRKDPWAAADWLKENPLFADQGTSPQNNFTDVLYSTLSEEHPEELERLAERTPPGDVRRTMEQMLFDRLLLSDPAAALEQARSTEVPLLASQRLGQVGLDCFTTDPAKAREIAGEILAKNPGNIDFATSIDFPGGSDPRFGNGKAGELMDALFSRDHAGTLEMIVNHNTGETGISPTLDNFIRQWAGEDLEDFAQWTNRQTGAVHQAGAEVIGYRLVDQGRYLESIHWTKSATSDPGSAYLPVLVAWQKSDPQAAAAWLESSDLTGSQKAKYKETLRTISR